MKTAALTLCLGSLLLAGCATKGPKRVTAWPMLPAPQSQAPTNWAVQDAPRNRPGAVMDPDSVVYAQVPSRIIYLPGGNRLFSRSSARQEVAYNLVAVDRVPEIQAMGTPTFETRPLAEGNTPKIPSMIPMNIGGVRGNGRRLGVIGKTDQEKERAQALLQKGESLQWNHNLGWVGFMEDVLPVPATKMPTAETPPPLPEIPEESSPKPPEIQAPGKSSEVKKEEKPQPSFKVEEGKEIKKRGLELSGWEE